MDLSHINDFIEMSRVIRHLPRYTEASKQYQIRVGQWARAPSLQVMSHQIDDDFEYTVAHVAEHRQRTVT